MKNFRRIIWGLVLIAAGVLFALDALEIMQFNLFFDGWWTLFIIVPCTVDLITERDKTGSLIGLAIGVGLLLWSRDVLDFDLLWKLFGTFVLVVLGLKMIFGGLFDRKTNELLSEMKKNGEGVRVASAVFSGSNLNFDGEVFEGAELNATFGGIKCDLRNAVIEKDCAIRATAVFGGVDILVPPNVNVIVNSTGIFGGTSNKASTKGGAVTLYVSSTSLFGGVDIK